MKNQSSTLFIIGLAALTGLFFHGVAENERLHNMSHAEYAARFAGSNIYHVNAGEPLKGIATDKIVFGPRRARDPYNTISLYQTNRVAQESAQFSIPFCYYPDGHGGQIKMPHVTYVGSGEVVLHEREFGEVRLPPGWGNCTLHVIDHLAYDAGAKDAFIEYVVDGFPPR